MTTWIQTFTGKKIDFLRVRPEDIDPRDIAHSLSLMCRFNGHVMYPYSIAQHSMEVLKRLPFNFNFFDFRDNRLWALLHDAAEAYLGDVTKPLKTLLADSRVVPGPSYSDLESAFETAIAKRFDLPLPIPKEVKWADAYALRDEALCLFDFPPIEDWTGKIEQACGGFGMPLPIRPLDARYAEQQFLRALADEGAEHG